MQLLNYQQACCDIFMYSFMFSMSLLQFYLNLTEANARGVLNWTLEYDAKAAYGMPDLSPASWNDVANSMEGEALSSTQKRLTGSSDNQAVLEQFVTFHYASSGHVTTCDASCRNKALCSVRSATSALYEACLIKHGVARDRDLSHHHH